MNNPIFKLVDQDAKWVEQRQNDKSITLNYQQYVSELEADRTYSDQFDAVKEYNNKLKFTVAPAEQERRLWQTASFVKKERWFSDLTADFYVEEAVNILDHLKVGIFRRTLAIK